LEQSESVLGGKDIARRQRKHIAIIIIHSRMETVPKDAAAAKRKRHADPFKVWAEVSDEFWH